MRDKLNNLTNQSWFRAIFFSIAYLATALFSREIAFQDASFPTLWFPSGLFVAFLLLNEIQTWPAYILAAFPPSLIYGLIDHQSLTAIAIFYISGSLEAVTGAWLVRRFDQRAGEFFSPTNVLNLIVLSTIFSTALCAFINATLMVTLVQGMVFWPSWQIAWAGHSLGILVAAPLILSWEKLRLPGIRQVNPERIIEVAVLTTGLVVCSLYIFVGNINLNRESYMVVPFLVWVALRFGPRGITVSGLIVTTLATWGTAHQLGGFASSDITIAPNIDSLGIFLTIILVTCYILATVWDQGKRTETALRESEERYRHLVENQGEGVGIINTAGILTFANPAANQIFGIKDLVGHSLKEFTTQQQFELIQQQTNQKQYGQKTLYELEITQPGGKRCNLLVSATPEPGNGGTNNGTFAVFRDNTERKQAEIALHDSRARFKTLFDHSPVPIWEEDFSRVKLLMDGLRRQKVVDFREFLNDHPEQIDACEQLIRVLDVNQSAIQIFGFNDKKSFLSQVNKMMERGPRDIFVEEIIAIAEGKTEFEMEGPNDLADGVIRYHSVRWSVAPGYEENYRRVIVTIIDITERKQAEEHMRYLSTHDVLTGLYNRNFFETEMDRLQNSRLEPVNVMMIDVNGMKTTNDTFGHPAGDELLRRTAQVLRMSFRKEDIIARIGGDEFVVLFHGSISIQDAVNRVKDCLANHNHWYDGSPLSLAIGAASGSKGSPLFDLFKKADQQMYREKVRSRKVRPDAKMDTKLGNSPQID